MPAPLRRLPASPPVARRGIGMIRVSKERHEMVSPEIQRYSIEAFAEREGIDIVGWIEGIDESGSRRKSRWWARLDSGVAEIEAGRADALLIWKFDRVGRNKLRWATAEDRVETAGGLILSATEPNDQSPAGRLNRDNMVNYAVYQAAVIGSTWKEAQERRVRHGLVYNHKARFGYIRETEHPSGYEPDPITAPLLRDFYLRYTAGTSARQLAIELHERGLRPSARVEPSYILDNLDSGFAAGKIRFRGQLYPGIHEPLITDAEWSAYQVARAARRLSPRAESTSYVLSGAILKCWCGSPMYGNSVGSHGRLRAIYACQAVVKARAHTGGTIGCHIADDAVLDWLRDKRDKIAAASKRVPQRPEPVLDAAAPIRARIVQLTDQLDAAGLRLVEGTLPNESYERIRDRLATQIAALDHDLKKIGTRPADPAPFIGDVLTFWERYTALEKRAALRFFVDTVTVHPPGTEPRVDVDSYLNDTHRE